MRLGVEGEEGGGGGEGEVKGARSTEGMKVGEGAVGWRDGRVERGGGPSKGGWRKKEGKGVISTEEES